MLQIQDQSQSPLTTAHLAQTMSLLALSNLELRERMLEELDQNPALELVEERACPTCHRPLPSGGPCPACSVSPVDGNSVVYLSGREAGRSASHRNSLDEDWLPREPAAPESLAAYVLQQTATQLEPGDRPLAEYILASLDEDGFLQDPPAILARVLHAPLSQIERVLQVLCHADPPGLATRGPREALIAQLETLDEPLAPLARAMLSETFEALGRRDFDGIAARLGVSSAEARRAATLIQSRLTPYPARAHWGSGRHPAQGNPDVYYTPDVAVTQRNGGSSGGFSVEIFAPFNGWLRVNPLFRASMAEVGEEVSEEWAQHVERAALFVKCLQQRGNTMLRMMRTLVDSQSEFIAKGDAYLVPMTRAQIAEELGVHESTISRAVSGKSIALPDGRIVPLARLFDRSLPVRVRIAEIVRFEKRPLTDDQIVERLRAEGIKIARRTVAKYRAIEGILPARLRKARRAAATRQSAGSP